YSLFWPLKRIDVFISLCHGIFLDIDFQIFLVGIEIWSEENKVNISDAADSSLLRFLEWREQVLLPRMHHDNVQLISGVRFKNHILGEAFLAQMCSESHSGGVIRDTGISPKELAKYIAHEIGHNLGMKHDTENCYCPVGPGSCPAPRYDIHPVFSECSRHSLTRFLEEKNITCLMNPPHTYIVSTTEGGVLRATFYIFTYHMCNSDTIAMWCL
uniref:Peptidase M12B domain-containing protein n=1 Tax=Xenopus tropicalis TaxID=8364 RepID=F7A6U7_XENTR